MWGNIGSETSDNMHDRKHTPCPGDMSRAEDTVKGSDGQLKRESPFAYVGEGAVAKRSRPGWDLKTRVCTSRSEPSGRMHTHRNMPHPGDMSASCVP